MPGLGFMVQRERPTLAAEALVGAGESLSGAKAVRQAAMLTYLGSPRRLCAGAPRRAKARGARHGRWARGHPRGRRDGN